MFRLTPSLQLAAAAAVLLLILQALPGVGSLFEYRRELLWAEPWRLFSGHLVHVNWTHAMVNAAAWLLLARLFEPVVNARRQLLTISVGALIISVALDVVYPSIAWYRGASGVLHALFFAGATQLFANALRAARPLASLRAALLLAAGWVKVALELPAGTVTPYADWLGSTIVPQAHPLGALTGSGLGLLFALRARRSASFRR